MSKLIRLRSAVIAGAALLAGTLLVTDSLVPFFGGDEPFPHASHDGLFPLCEGCHIGIVTGVASEIYPAPANCAQCHDGVREGTVEWKPPGMRASNLRFDHPDHQEQVESEGVSATCRTCHAPDNPPVRMAISAAPPEGCLQCHVHQAEAHLAKGAECAVCHIPLTRAERIPVERIALFPWPASHESDAFLSTHAPGNALELLSCGVCHARNSCERCHANADRLEEITLLEHDDRVASLELGRRAEYPLPESHLDSDWSWDHGATAFAAPAGCTNCHTRPSCNECHLDGGQRAAGVIAALPGPVPGGAPGVDLERAGEGVHPWDFAQRHGTFAATGVLQCNECHSQQYCSDCHSGADSREFHPLNFIERHALEVFAGSSNCQSCHSTEAFCRDCHAATGLASEGQMNAAFHTAQPFWILSHGQAARIGLETCAACHRQTDCLACHSTFLGRGVNPHGPGFDAGRMAARNRVTCQWCHLGGPPGES